MTEAITVGDLYEALRTKLRLDWVAGRSGAQRVIQGEQHGSSATSLIGHLNLIHPHRIQVIGHTERDYLGALKKNSRKDTVSQLFDTQPELIIVASGEPVPEDVGEAAAATDTPVFTSRLPSQELINNVQYFLASNLAEKTVVHGVFMEVMGIGVLITGDSSIGKSEMALELVSRGHRLIADDAPEFARIAPDIISGTCPEVLQDFLEVRGLGVLNIRAMFGDSAIKPTKYLRLIIRLENMTEEQLNGIDRLKGSRRTRALLGIEIPEITLPVTPGRNLSVLAEAAVRDHILLLKGYDASAAFAERHQRRIENNPK